MRLLLLTTPALHHVYFAWKLHETFPLSGILLETEALVPRFETRHNFEDERDRYERDTAFAGAPQRCRDVAETVECARVGDDSSVRWLKAHRPDAMLVFGTRHLVPAVVGISRMCLNLHGGHPEYYRGLDTHLWAVYHEDFSNLVTTLHEVSGELDAGNIVLQTALSFQAGAPIHQLRAVNTEACVRLTRIALHSLAQLGSLPARPQVGRGRYYSFMPAVLKEECVRKFQRFTGTG